MADNKAAENTAQAFLDLETELLIAKGVADIICAFGTVKSSGNSLDLFENGIWLIGNIATDNAQRIEELVRMCDLA